MPATTITARKIPRRVIMTIFPVGLRRPIKHNPSPPSSVRDTWPVRLIFDRGRTHVAYKGFLLTELAGDQHARFLGATTTIEVPLSSERGVAVPLPVPDILEADEHHYRILVR